MIASSLFACKFTNKYENYHKKPNFKHTYYCFLNEVHHEQCVKEFKNPLFLLSFAKKVLTLPTHSSNKSR